MSTGGHTCRANIESAASKSVISCFWGSYTGAAAADVDCYFAGRSRSTMDQKYLCI